MLRKSALLIHHVEESQPHDQVDLGQTFQYHFHEALQQKEQRKVYILGLLASTAYLKIIPTVHLKSFMVPGSLAMLTHLASLSTNPVFLFYGCSKLDSCSNVGYDDSEAHRNVSKNNMKRQEEMLDPK